MDTSSGPKAHTEAFYPGLSGPVVGPKSEILQRIKIRKAQLKFRRTVLLKRQQFRMRVSASEDQEEEVQIPELVDISRELQGLTAKERELGYFDDEDDEDLTPEILTEECIHWPAPPPCNVPDANKVVPTAELGRKPAVTKCPSCGAIGTTKTAKKRGDAPWLVCGLTAVFGCIGGCCLIPFCLDSLKDVHHSCPSCQTTIHILQKI